MKYKNAFETNYEMTLLEESFWGGADILSLALKSMVSVVEDGGTDFQKQVEKAYKDRKDYQKLKILSRALKLPHTLYPGL